MTDVPEPPAQDVDSPTLPPESTPLTPLTAAFPEARAVARELADSASMVAREFAESVGEGGTAPLKEDDWLPAVGPKKPRQGVGLRGSDEFVRRKPERGTEQLTEPTPVAADDDPEGQARVAAVIERRWDALVAQAEDALRIATSVLDPIDSKMNAVRLGLDLAARPEHDRTQRIALLPPEIHALMKALINRVHAEPSVARRLQVALFQFSDARRSASAVKERLERARELPRDEALDFLAKIEVPKIKGKLYTCSMFPQVFRGDPVLGRLFPLRGVTAPTTTPATAAVPVAGTGPLTPKPVASPTGELGGAPTQPTDATSNGAGRGTGSLKDAWDAVRAKLGKKKPG